MIWTAHKIALFPTPVKVCGVTLHPPTVGHFQILEHLENPYTCGGDATLEQLLSAVLVCQRSFSRGVRMIRSPIILALRMKWLALRMYRMKLEWKAESTRFRRFIDECSWVPERFKDEHEKMMLPNGIPTSYRIIDCLLSCGFRDAEILDMPLPKANLHILAHSANKGSEYESLDDYKASGFPEGYAYHPEDWPTVKTMLDNIKAYEDERKKNPALEPVNVKASIEKAAAHDLKIMEESRCAN